MNAVESHTRTVGELVAEKPMRARLFEQLGIDYCCGGKRPIETACEEKGLHAPTLLALLDAIDTLPVEQGINPAAMSMTELADHIVQTHHGYLRREFPRLTKMIARVAAVHGDKDARLQRLAEVFDGFVAELECHMIKEEQILFPICRALDQANGPTSFHCGSVANPIRMMEHEHDIAGNGLVEMRRLTSDFSPPAGACNTWRAMLDGLATLETDMHQHIHKENNVLFPRAIAKEAEAGCAASR